MATSVSFTEHENGNAVLERKQMVPLETESDTRTVDDGGDNHAANTSTVESPRLLGTLQLAVIVFYSVSGGPFGIEPSVRAAGAFYTLVGLVIFPILWSVPEAAITAELGSAYPEAAGGIAWVEEAFGPKVGWMAGFMNWVSGAVDTTIYPVLFLDYCLQAVSGGVDEIHPLLRFILVSSLAVILSYINWLGLPVVGELSLYICVITMSPFVLACILGASEVDPQRWLQMPEDPPPDVDDDEYGGIIPSLVIGGVVWRPFLNNMFWNLNSFDSGASFSAEVDNPGRAFPRAMFWSVLFVFLGYFIPLLVLLGASDAPQSAWVDGYLATAVSDVVGKWLGDWTIVAAGVTNIALFQAEMSADSFQLMGMAERGYVPKIFATRSRHGTPTYGILVGLAIVVLMSVSDLSTLIEMLNLNYAISLLMEYAAFLKLRVSKPDLHRPYRIPISTLGCFIVLTPTILVTLLVMTLASFATYLFTIGSMGVAYAIYSAHNWKTRGGRCCNYSAVPSDTEQSTDDLNGIELPSSTIT